MTLEEVKEHFKNAKEVRCLCDGKVYNLNHASERGIYEYGCSFWFWDSNINYDCELWDKGEGFAEIISYKKDAQRIKEDLELLDKFLKGACSYSVESQIPCEMLYVGVYETNSVRIEQFKKDNGLTIEPTELDKLKQSHAELMEKAEEIKQQIDKLK